jgi:hypothetical protein
MMAGSGPHIWALMIADFVVVGFAVRRYAQTRADFRDGPSAE